MKQDDTLFLSKQHIYFLPVFHYNMETAALARQAFLQLKPDCVAVELPETMSLQMMHAASRLPDISVIAAVDDASSQLYYLSEPCDAAFEGLRSALESQTACFCIDLDVHRYPQIKENVPDPYAISKIGLKRYYEAFCQLYGQAPVQVKDQQRELYMAKRLKELSFSYEKILFIGGMTHISRIMQYIDLPAYPAFNPAQRASVELFAPTENACRDILGEFGWVSTGYEANRTADLLGVLDRQKLIYDLYKSASESYMEETGYPFPGYHMRNVMKFARNYSLLTQRLMPDLYQILSCAKGCVDHNYAYEVWLLGTSYPHLRNIDQLPERDFSVEDVWGASKTIQFHLKQRSQKLKFSERRKKDSQNYHFSPPGRFTICSYPPEDIAIEKFGGFLQKKSIQLLTEEASRTIPFSTSIEDGIDTKESIRHWHEKTLYVKARGRPPGGVGSVVMIFDEDEPHHNKTRIEKYTWRTTWIGEHNQESDMAFYATPLAQNIVGPGMSRCEYGGFMMSYPPRRVFDVWSDLDYALARSKSEVLLLAAIDYALKPLITYVAAKPPRSSVKTYAQRYGKKIVYIPIGQLSPVTLNKLRAFHVLDGRDRRDIAPEYIN